LGFWGFGFWSSWDEGEDYGDGERGGVGVLEGSVVWEDEGWLGTECGISLGAWEEGDEGRRDQGRGRSKNKR